MNEHNQNQNPQDIQFTWVRCVSCGNGLWREYADRLVMPLTLRGGQKRIISISKSHLETLNVACEKCGCVWDGTDISPIVRFHGAQTADAMEAPHG